MGPVYAMGLSPGRQLWEHSGDLEVLCADILISVCGRGRCLLPPPGLAYFWGLWVDKEGLTMCQRDSPHLIVLMGQTLCLHSIFSHRSLTFKALDFPAIMSANLHNILKVLTDKIKTQLSCVVPLDIWREMLLVDRIWKAQPLSCLFLILSPSSLFFRELHSVTLSRSTPVESTLRVPLGCVASLLLQFL